MIALVTGQQVAFWVFAPLAIALALGMVFSRKPVHSALSLAGMMVCLGCLYASLSAPFLFVAQIIVYTGAIMMLFVFTMMIIGIDSIDTMVETLRGQRVLAVIGALGFLCLVGGALVDGIRVTNPAGIETANNKFGGNTEGLAHLLFNDYIFAFEITGALLITAVLAAMILTHAPRVKKEDQRSRAARKIREFETSGKYPGTRPGSGSYARHNSIDYPALAPDGQAEPTSVSPTLKVRGDSKQAAGLVSAHLAAGRAIAEALDELDGTDEAARFADPNLTDPQHPQLTSESSDGQEQ